MSHVIISAGAQDWQIFQQEAGYGRISLEGSCRLEPGEAVCPVAVRVVREDTGETVLPWTAAQTEPDGAWRLTLDRVPAGGLYRIETCMRCTAEGEPVWDYPCRWDFGGDTRHHIGVGELFVIAGQSNAAGYGEGAVSDPPQLGVHMLRSSDRWDLAAHPLNDSTDTRHSANAESGNSGHSPYLAFARMVQKYRGCPVGLIPCALGGSPLSQWLPPQGDLYCNMIDRIREAGSRVAGVLWYQGCTDALAGDCDGYEAGFLSLVDQVRQTLQRPDLPFFTCQLGRLVGVGMTGEDLDWSRIREIQRHIPRSHRGIYVLPTLDGMISDCIHNGPAYNVLLGERLARQVLSVLWGYDFPCFAPDLEEVRCQGNALTLRFAPVYGYLYCFTQAPDRLPFRIHDDLGPIAVTQLRQQQPDALDLTLSRPPQGTLTVHCGYGPDPAGPMVVDFATRYPVLAFSWIGSCNDGEQRV